MKKFSKVIGILIALTMVVSMAFAIGCNDEPEKTITISESAVAMGIFDEKTLTATTTNITGDIEWSNSDDTVINMTETADGVKIIAIRAGSATVSATAEGKTATSVITVTGEETLSLALSSTASVTLFEGETSAIQTAVSFKETAFTKASLAYSVEAVPVGCVTVSNEGLITAVSAGQATVTAKASYLGVESNAVTVAVTVSPALAVQFADNTIEITAPNKAGLATSATVTAKIVSGETELSTAPTLKSAVSADEDVVVYEEGAIKAVAAGETTVTFTYEYEGRDVVGSVTVTVAEAPAIYFGQEDAWAHDGVVAKMEAGKGLVIENVAIPTYVDGTSLAESLIRFQFIPEQIGAGPIDGDNGCKTPFGPRVIYITIQDATTPSNYITILVRQAWDPGVEETTVGVGVQTNVMAETLENTYYGLDQAAPSHWINVITPTSGYGKYVDLSLTGEHLDMVNYTEGMLGFAINGTKLYMQCGGSVIPLWDLTDFAGITAFENYKWDGFTGSNVNLFIKVDDFQNGATSAQLSIDTLGGTALVAGDVSKFAYASMPGKVAVGYEDDHTCVFEWITDADSHKKACTVVGCTEVEIEDAEHDFVDGECTVCEHVCLHDFEDGVCGLCAIVCEHEWEDGECSICDVVCAHEWANGECTVCEFECTHNWANGECTVCELECAHADRDDNGNCTVCGAGCEHEWVDGECDNCGTVCGHSWSNGVCNVCTFVCEHEWEDGDCNICDAVCTHDFEDGVCADCELVCDHDEISEGACTLCGESVNANVTYGEHAQFAGVNGIIAKMTEGDTLAFMGIKNDGTKADTIIRLQIVQTVGYDGTSQNYYNPVGAKNIYITIQDANNPLNYVTILLSALIVDGEGAYFSHGAKIGARASIFSAYEVDSTTAGFYANKFSGPISVNTSGWVGYNQGIGGFSFYNTLLGNGTENMLAISIEGTKVYFTDAGGTPSIELIDLESVTGNTAWPGFVDTNDLNVYVTTTGFNGAEYSELVIDTLGNKALTAHDKAGFTISKLGTSLIPDCGHTHTYGEYSRNASEHWRECDNEFCFVIEEGSRAVHDLSSGACLCGLAHTHEWNATYDDLSHFEQCQCTEKQNSESHVIVEGACECGYQVIRFGQTDSWAHDGVLANMSAGNALVKENVSLTTEQTESIVRLQLIPLANNKPYSSTYAAPKGPSTIYVTFQDSANLDNYVTIIITTYKYNDGDYYTYAACMGARVSSWGEYDTTVKSDDSFASVDGSVGTNGGYGYGYGYGAFSLYGDWLNASAYANNMLGFSIVGTKVYINGAGQSQEMVDLENVTGKDAWTGFTGDSVNVIVSCADFSGVDNALISVDTIGGEAVTSAEGFKFVEVGTALVPSQENA